MNNDCQSTAPITQDYIHGTRIILYNNLFHILIVFFSLRSCAFIYTHALQKTVLDLSTITERGLIGKQYVWYSVAVKRYLANPGWFQVGVRFSLNYWSTCFRIASVRVAPLCNDGWSIGNDVAACEEISPYVVLLRSSLWVDKRMMLCKTAPNVHATNTWWEFHSIPLL